MNPSSSHPQRIWIVLFKPEDRRFGVLLEQFAVRLRQQTGASVSLVMVENGLMLHEAMAQVIPDEEWVKGPDIVVAEHRGWIAALELPPQIFKVTHTFPEAFEWQVDALLMPHWQWKNLSQDRFTPEHNNCHVFALENCQFEPIRYENACREMASLKHSDNKETWTILIGKPSDLDTSTETLISAIAQRAAERQVRLLVSFSKRTAEDALVIRRAFAGLDAEYLLPATTGQAPADDYYRYLARADRIIVLDSGSMTAEAAHIGKPIYAEKHTRETYPFLQPYTQLLTESSMFDDVALPPIDIADDMGNGLLAMYHQFRQRKATASPNAGFAERVMRDRNGAVAAWR